MNKTKKILHKYMFIIMIMVQIIMLIGCSSEKIDKIGAQNKGVSTIEEKAAGGSEVTGNNGILKVHYIDVGQADSILIEENKKFMLIDTGNNDDGNKVVEYLKAQGVKKLDYLVLTHPHEDHIGGADTVIKEFNIGRVYMPKITQSTATFKDVVKVMQLKGLKATVPVVGDTFKIGDAQATILAPNENKYEDLNNYSIVIRVVYAKTSFLFSGDAEETSEKEILSKGLAVKSDVLKVGHHGSTSSTSTAFLKAVAPKYAIISVGKNNDYGHPHSKTLDKLKSQGIDILRTDLMGTIVATSNGSSITFNKKINSDNVTQNANLGRLIKGNINSKGEKIYHVPGGAYYEQTVAEELFKTEADAQAAGYRKSKK